MNKEIICKLEKRLFNAMINDDIEESEVLLDEDMVFVNHFGMILSKADDINSHKQKIFKMQSIEMKKQTISMFKHVAVAISEAIVTVSMNGQEQTDYLLYSRTWQETESGIKMIAGSAVHIQRA